MIFIKLPHIGFIDLEMVPDDLEDIVKVSFEKFSEETHRDMIFKDKLLYIDRLRNDWIGFKETPYDIFAKVLGENARQIILLNQPQVDMFELMEEAARRTKRDFEREYSEDENLNDEVKRVLVRIITVVMNYEVE